MENLSKDLDDLVSLYEIVSEQMNPFVGLSKVTKKRLDALENIIQEVDGVKTKLGDLEAMVEKTNSNERKKIQSTPSITPPVELKNKTEMPPLQKTPLENQSGPEEVSQPAEKQKNDNKLDDVLDRTIQSLFMEQNIDSMINEFFITLK